MIGRPIFAAPAASPAAPAAVFPTLIGAISATVLLDLAKWATISIATCKLALGDPPAPASTSAPVRQLISLDDGAGSVL